MGKDGVESSWLDGWLAGWVLHIGSGRVDVWMVGGGPSSLSWPLLSAAADARLHKVKPGRRARAPQLSGSHTPCSTRNSTRTGTVLSEPLIRPLQRTQRNLLRRYSAGSPKSCREPRTASSVVDRQRQDSSLGKE